MAMIPLFEAKTYLRVDSSDEDALIGSLLASAQQLCVDVARLSDKQWEIIDSGKQSAKDFPKAELKRVRNEMRVAILYALGYLYEHREEADHHALSLTLRSLLSAIREGVV